MARAAGPGVSLRFAARASFPGLRREGSGDRFGRGPRPRRSVRRDERAHGPDDTGRGMAGAGSTRLAGVFPAAAKAPAASAGEGG